MFSDNFDAQSMTKVAVSKATLLSAARKRGKNIPQALMSRLRYVDEIIPGTEEHAWLMKIISKNQNRTAQRLAGSTEDMLETMFFGGPLPSA